MTVVGYCRNLFLVEDDALRESVAYADIEDLSLLVLDGFRLLFHSSLAKTDCFSCGWVTFISFCSIVFGKEDSVGRHSLAMPGVFPLSAECGR